MKGVYFGCQVAANDMLERDDPGAIINTASISSEEAQYESTKGAVKMITRGAALELGEHGIRINAIAPGFIVTEILDGLSEEVVADVKDVQTAV